jgi:hypothetical protein
MGSGGGITFVQLDRMDTVAPNPVNQGNISVSTTPTRVDFQFPGTSDDANGKGVSHYVLYRAPAPSFAYSPIGEMVPSFGQYSDLGVSAGTA